MPIDQQEGQLKEEEGTKEEKSDTQKYIGKSYLMYKTTIITYQLYTLIMIK